MTIADVEASGYPASIITGIAGSISAEFSEECRVFKRAWNSRQWGEIWGDESLEVVLSDWGTPIAQQQAFRVAQAVSYEPALELLAKLYDRGVLPASSLARHRNGNMPIAVGLLAAAGLCDVSPLSVRLSAEGRDVVEGLVKGGPGAGSEK